MALNASGTSVARTTTMSSGRRVFTANGSRSQGMREPVRKLAT